MVAGLQWMVLDHFSFAAGCVILQRRVHCGHGEVDVLSSKVGCGTEQMLTSVRFRSLPSWR